VRIRQSVEAEKIFGLNCVCAEKGIDHQRKITILILSTKAASTPGRETTKETLHEGALALEMNNTAIRTVYDFPVAGHLCEDGTVRYIKLSRRPGNTQPQGVCPQCQTSFQYQKPQRSKVRHYSEAGA
jgi:hypothetical protein